MPRELEIALLGHAPETSEWLALLGGPGRRVVRSSDAAEALAGSPELVMAAVTDAKDAAVFLDALGSPDAPALALLVGAAHPLRRLVGALLQAKRDWEGAFDAIVDPVAIVDATGAVRRANVGLARVVGAEIRALSRRTLADLLGAADGEDPVAASLADGIARTAEVRYARLPGSRLVTTSPLEDAGEGRGLVVTLKDVSGHREREARLQQAARLADVGRLAAGVAHEINTPLASIALRAEALLRSASDPVLADLPALAKFPRYLRSIDEEIFRCKKIVGGLLDFSRSRAPEVRPTDLNALCGDAAELLRHQMRLKALSLELRLEPGLGPLPADEGQLRQVLVALLMNAIDACGREGRILVETSRADGGVRLVVADDGAGMPREDLDKAFTPFFTTKPLGRGTGLGLAVCHGVVAAHGGRIELQSEPSRGTRVTVLLPDIGEPR